MKRTPGKWQSAEIKGTTDWGAGLPVNPTSIEFHASSFNTAVGGV